jgi:hypothetical protein
LAFSVLPVPTTLAYKAATSRLLTVAGKTVRWTVLPLRCNLGAAAPSTLKRSWFESNRWRQKNQQLRLLIFLSKPPWRVGM